MLMRTCCREATPARDEGTETALDADDDPDAGSELDVEVRPLWARM
jgi:hypothetical protein